jgi:phenylalanyl-tRNA synthetase alpha chain
MHWPPDFCFKKRLETESLVKPNQRIRQFEDTDKKEGNWPVVLPFFVFTDTFESKIMSIEAFVKDLDDLATSATQTFAAAETTEQLNEARIEFLGAKKGRLKALQKNMGSVPGENKKEAGMKLNAVKQAIQTSFDDATQRLGNADGNSARDPKFDPTLPGTKRHIGRLHPITQTINELKDIMGRLGFTPALGPEVEDDQHNFESLNIPKSHPARDPLDNFYLSVADATSGADASVVPLSDNPLLMRSQTSTVQIRVMEKTQPPIRIVSLGRVYRPDSADWSHYPMFHQIEGLMVDTHVTLADLKTVLKLFASNYLGDEVPIRIRPSFFPFTEPSVEADYYWNGKWVEFGGAGVVDPNVLRSVGYDPEKVSGFAFGLGIERLCMIRHQITDIRYLFTNDVRFLRQF